jgi:hypothetical protein
VQLLPAPGIHADLAPSSAFPLSNEQRPAARVEIGFVEQERFLDPQARSPQDDDQPTEPLTVRAPAARITAMISSTVGGSAGYRRPLFAGDRPA